MEGRGLSKSFISRVIIGVTPFRVLITLLLTYLLSPLPLQVHSFTRRVLLGCSSWGFGFMAIPLTEKAYLFWELYIETIIRNPEKIGLFGYR